MMYLFACSKPRNMFIISICLCTTRPDCARMFVAGWEDLMIALASSEMWTGAKRLFAASSVLARTFETEGGGGGCVPVLAAAS